MRAQLRKAWESRAPRERAIIAALAVMLGAALYVWLVQSAGQARVQLRTGVTTLRAQAARLEQQAAELERLRAAPALSASQTDLRTLVQAQAGAAGLSRALVRIDAPDANQVTVVFGALPFADWLAWVASLQAQHVRLDACRIEALSTPGLISVTATLVRAKPQ
jgi:general secretion pathway protein M